MVSSSVFLKTRIKRKPKGLGQKSEWRKKKAFALRVNEDMLKAIEKWAADECVVQWLNRMDAPEKLERDKW